MGLKENIWKKEVLPLEGKKLDDNSNNLERIKLILTNTINNGKIIFLFKFRNISLVTYWVEYSFNKEEYDMY